MIFGQIKWPEMIAVRKRCVCVYFQVSLPTRKSSELSLCRVAKKSDRRGHHFSAAAKTTTSPSSSLSFATLEYEVFVCLVT